jgi:ubiquinone/menaquinone biosynthesis C-methylase UbiE
MRISSLEAHSIWAASYDTTPNPLLALERRVLQDLLRVATAMRVVDVACGTGRWAAWFQERGATVVGIDACMEMLARAPAPLRGRFALARAEDLPLACDIADLTLCSFAAGYFFGLDRAIAEMARMTRSGGSVVIADLHPAAVATGWNRSFRAAGRIYELEHCGYLVADFIGAAEKAGLHLAAEIHAHFGEPERPFFEMAGRPERFAQVTDVPAIWVGSWRKA